MEVNETRQDGIVVLALKGRLDSNTSGNFEKQLLGMVQGGETRVVLDFSELDYISSAGLRVLLKAVKELKRTNGRICVCAVKDYIREIFTPLRISFLSAHTLHFRGIATEFSSAELVHCLASTSSRVFTGLRAQFQIKLGNSKIGRVSTSPAFCSEHARRIRQCLTCFQTHSHHHLLEGGVQQSLPRHSHAADLLLVFGVEPVHDLIP